MASSPPPEAPGVIYHEAAHHGYAWPVVVGAIALSLASNIVAIIASRRLLSRNRTVVTQVRWSSLMMYLNAEGFVFNAICLIQCSINAAAKTIVSAENGCLAQGVYSTFFMLAYVYTLALIAFTGYRAVTANATISPSTMLWFHVAAWAWAGTQTGILTSYPGSVQPLPSGVSCFAVLANVRAAIVFFGLGVLPVMAALVFMYSAMYAHVRARSMELQRDVSVMEATVDPARKQPRFAPFTASTARVAPDAPPAPLERPPSPNTSFMFGGSAVYRTVTPQPQHRTRVASDASGVHDRHMADSPRLGGMSAAADTLQLSVRSVPGMLHGEGVSDVTDRDMLPSAVPAAERHSTVHASATTTTADDAAAGADGGSTIIGSGIAMDVGRRTRNSVGAARRLSGGVNIPPTAPLPVRLDPEPVQPGSSSPVGAVAGTMTSLRRPRSISASPVIEPSARQHAFPVLHAVPVGAQSVDASVVARTRVVGAQLAMSIAQADSGQTSRSRRASQGDMGPDSSFARTRYAIADRVQQRHTVTRIAHRHWVVATRVAVLFAAYVLCWSPIFVVALYASTGHVPFPIMGVLAAALAHLLTFTNCVLHMMFNSALRHEVLDILSDMRAAAAAGDAAGLFRALIASQKGAQASRAAASAAATSAPLSVSPEETGMLA